MRSLINCWSRLTQLSRLPLYDLLRCLNVSLPPTTFRHRMANYKFAHRWQNVLQGGSESPWYRNVQVANRPGSESSKVVVKHPGSKLAKWQNVHESLTQVNISDNIVSLHLGHSCHSNKWSTERLVHERLGLRRKPRTLDDNNCTAIVEVTALLPSGVYQYLHDRQHCNI